MCTEEISEAGEGLGNAVQGFTYVSLGCRSECSADVFADTSLSSRRRITFRATFNARAIELRYAARAWTLMAKDASRSRIIIVDVDDLV